MYLPAIRINDDRWIDVNRDTLSIDIRIMYLHAIRLLAMIGGLS